jgi:hypothetical protein
MTKLSDAVSDPSTATKGRKRKRNRYRPEIRQRKRLATTSTSRMANASSTSAADPSFKTSFSSTIIASSSATIAKKSRGRGVVLLSTTRSDGGCPFWAYGCDKKNDKTHGTCKQGRGIDRAGAAYSLWTELMEYIVESEDHCAKHEPSGILHSAITNPLDAMKSLCQRIVAVQDLAPNMADRPTAADLADPKRVPFYFKSLWPSVTKTSRHGAIPRRKNPGTDG